MSLLISFRSEIIKTRRTSIWYLCIIAATLAPLFSYNDSSSLYRIESLKNDPWNVHMLGMGGRIFNMMILPFFLMLVCTLLAQLEYRNNTWKQVYVSPQSFRSIFISKYLLIQLMLIGVCVLTILLMFGSLLAIDLFKTNLNLSHHQLDWKSFIVFFGRIYITVLAICTFQFWLSLRFKNFILPIVIGICLYLAATMMMEENPMKFDTMFPYIYPLRNCFPYRPSDETAVIWGSLAYTAVFIVLGFFDFNRRRSTS